MIRVGLSNWKTNKHIRNLTKVQDITETIARQNGDGQDI